MIYKPKDFELYEFLPEDFYETYKHRGMKLWLIFDIRVLITSQRLRERYGRMIMNDYHWGGIHQERGYRNFYTKTGALFSQHKFGRGGDSKFSDVTPDEIREDIQKHPDDETFEFITCIEEAIGWFHFDTRNWDKTKSGILIVRPKVLIARPK